MFVIIRKNFENCKQKNKKIKVVFWKTRIFSSILIQLEIKNS